MIHTVYHDEMKGKKIGILLKVYRPEATSHIIQSVLSLLYDKRAFKSSVTYEHDTKERTERIDM